MPTDVFSSTLMGTQSKENSVVASSEVKATLLSDITARKRERMLSPVQTAIDKLYAAADQQIQDNPGVYEPAIVPEHPAESAVRGGKEALMGVPMTAVGLAAGAGAIAENLTDGAEWATNLKESAVEQYHKFEAKMGQNARPEDSFLYSYDQAKKGNLGALVSWVSHGSGYVSTQLATLLTGAGLIEKGVELTSKKAVANLMGGLVKKEANRIAEAEMVKVATAEMVQQATATVTSKLGQHLGMATMGFGMEGGEIGGDLASQSVERGTPLTNKEIAKGLTGTAAAGAVEYMETVLGLKAIKGQLGKIPGSTKNISGVKGKVSRSAVGAAKVAPAEFVQEFTQTGIEQWAGGHDFDVKEAIDAGAIGVIGAQHAVIGGAFSRSNKEQDQAEVQAGQKRLVQSEAQPGFTEKVKDAVKEKNPAKYFNIESSEYDPIAGMEATKVIHKDEKTSSKDKNSAYNQGLTAFNELTTRADQILDAAEGQDKKTADAAFKEVDHLLQIRKKLKPIIESMGPSGATTPELKEALKEAKTSLEVETAISNILGSRSAGQDLHSFIDETAIAENPAVEPRVKRIAKGIKTLGERKTNLAKYVSELTTTEDVTDDIFNGSFASGGQKGINNYIFAIQSATIAKNTTVARQEFEQLTAFADRKRTRAVTFRNALDGTMTPEDEQNLAIYQKERTRRGQTPYDINANTITAMELEADALDAAVALGSTISGIPPTRNNAPVVQQPASEQPSPLTSESAGQKGEGTTKALSDMSVKELQEAWRAVPPGPDQKKQRARIKAIGVIKKQAALKAKFDATDKNSTTERKALVKQSEKLKVQTTSTHIDELLTDTKMSVANKLGQLEDFYEDDFNSRQNKQFEALYDQLTDKEYEELYAEKRPKKQSAAPSAPASKSPSASSSSEVANLKAEGSTIKKSPQVKEPASNKEEPATTPVAEPVKSTWGRRANNSYEVSSRGDTRFSAYNARLKNGNTIEEEYQIKVKGYPSVKQGKGKPPLNKLSKQESWLAYKNLWRRWVRENPTLFSELQKNSKGKVLTDMFANTEINQARALSELLNELPPATQEKTTPPSNPPSKAAQKNIAVFEAMTTETLNSVLKNVGPGSTKETLIKDILSKRETKTPDTKAISSEEQDYLTTLQSYISSDTYGGLPQKTGNTVYHGTRAERVTVNSNGSLVLNSSNNFEDKQTGISFTEFLDTAKFYGERRGGKTRRASGTVILQIKKSALPELSRESIEELLVKGEKTLTIPKADYTLHYADANQNAPAPKNALQKFESGVQNLVDKAWSDPINGMYQATLALVTSLNLDEQDEQVGNSAKEFALAHTASSQVPVVEKWGGNPLEEALAEFHQKAFKKYSTPALYKEFLAKHGKKPVRTVYGYKNIAEFSAEFLKEPTKTETKDPETPVTNKPLGDVLTDRKATPALTDTNYNTINSVRATWVKRAGKITLHEIQNFAKWLQARAVKSTNSAAEDVFYKSFATFDSDFTTALKGVFKANKNPDFNYKNLVNHLLINGVLPDNVMSSISAAVYKWIGTQSSKTTFNDDRAIRKMLGLKKEATVPPKARELMTYLGQSGPYLHETLGRDIIKLIGIQAGEESNANDQKRMEAAIGALAVATLQRMQLVKRTPVNRGVRLLTKNVNGVEVADEENPDFINDDTATQGFQGLINRMKKGDPTEDLSTQEFFNILQGSGAKGTQSVAFFTIAHENKQTGHTTTAKGSETVTAIKEAYHQSKDTWDTLFTGSNDKLNYHWKKPYHKKGTRYPLGHGDLLATEEQSENLHHNNSEAVELNGHMMSVLSLLDQDSTNTIYGSVDETNVPADQIMAARSENNRIKLSQEHLGFWLNNAVLQPLKYAAHFFIPAVFGLNGRMYQKGTIKMQADKAQRFIFSLKKWKTQFDTTGSTERDVFLQRSFMEAIGQSLGIEAGKESTLDVVLDKTETALQDPLIQKALTAIDTLLDQMGAKSIYDPAALTNITLSAKDTAAIVAGVQKAGEKVHSLKGLIEYQRYQRAKANTKDSSFITDMSKEIDGKANGHFIAGIQFMASDITAAQLSQLINTGLIIYKDMDPADHNSNHDPYQAISAIWGHNIETHKRSLLDQNTPAAAHKEFQIRAIEYIMGSLIDKTTGKLSREARSLTKGRATASLFGSGESSINEGLVRESVINDGIMARLVTIANLEDTAEMEKQFGYLAKAIQIITDRHDFRLAKGQAFTKENVLSVTLSDLTKSRLVAMVGRYQGAALNNAISEVYTDIKTVSKTLGKGVTLATAYYNIAYQFLLNQHKGRLTNKDVKAIREKVAGILPIFATPKGGQIALYEYEQSIDYSQNTDDEVVAYYQNDKIANKKAPTYLTRTISRPRTEGLLAQPGVGTVPGLTHNLDSITMNYAMGSESIVNNHDGVMLGIGNKSISETLNRELYDNLRNHSIPQAVKEATDTSVAAYETFIKGLTREEQIRLYPIKERLFKRFGLYQTKELKSLQAVASNVQEMVNALVPSTIENKNEILDAAVGMNNYHEPDGGYTTGNPQRERVGNIAVTSVLGDTRIKIDALAQKNLDTINPPVKEDISNEEVVDSIVKESQFPLPTIKRKKIKYTLTVPGTKTKHTKIGYPIFIQGYPNLQFYLTKDKIYDTGVRTDKTWQIDDALSGYEIPVNVLNPTIPGMMQGLQEGLTAALETEPGREGLKTIGIVLGSSVEPMSIDPNEYDTEQQINQGNVVDTYDKIKDNSNITDSPEHAARLRNILTTLVQKVMGPVDLYLKTNPEEETHGQFDTITNKIFISSQTTGTSPVSGALATGIRMSTGEVYTHELIHAVVHSALRLNKHLEKQVERLYDLAKQALDYKAFLNDPTIDVKDPANYYEVQAAKKRYAYIFRGGSVSRRDYTEAVTRIERVEELSSHLDEFISLGLSNENFFKALTQISTVRLQQRVLAKSTWSGLVGSNLQETIVNVFSKIMEILYEKFDKGIPANTIGAELQRLTELLVKIDSKNKTKAYNATQGFDKVSGRISDKGNALIKKAFKTAPALKLGHNLKAGFAEARKSDSALGQALRNIEYKYDSLEYGLGKAIITEMRGNTPRVDFLHRLLHRRKNFLDSSKEAIIRNTKKVAGNRYHREMTAEEKVTVLKVGMKPDLAYLLDSTGIDEIATLLDDQKELNTKILGLKNELQNHKELSAHATHFIQSADALGHLMVTGRLRAGENTVPNTRVIAELLNTKHENTLTAAQADMADVLINKLATLYAVQYTAVKQRKALANLIAEDSDGIARILRLHAELKKDAIEHNFEGNGNAYQFIKGYTKEIFNPRMEYQLGTLADEKEFIANKFIRSTHPIARDASDPQKHIDLYIFTADTGRVNDYQSFIFSLTSNRGKGSSPFTVKEMQKIIQDKQVELNAMANSRPTPAPGGNFLVPQVDDQGKIVKYRYMMAESTKDAYLEKMNEFDTVMGAMAGQIMDKARSPVINEELIKSLKLLYDEEYDNNPSAYVEVSAHSEDPRLREMYYMLPAKTRRYVEEIWGDQQMFVAKDVLTIAFGYRKYSFVQAFAKTPAERHWMEKAVVGLANFVFRKYNIKAVNNIELVMMALTKLAKNNIVVRTLYVTLENFGSNIMYLRLKGVPLLQILKNGFLAFKEGLRYQTEKQQLGEAEVALKLITDPQEKRRAELQIIRLKDKLARNPVAKAIEAGLLPTLVDDIETDATQNNFPGKTEKFLDKVAEKLPKPLVTIGKVIFLEQSTGAYKIMNNAVKMTDFVGRFVLYEHYTQEAKTTEGQLAIRESLGSTLGRVPTAEEIKEEAHSQAVLKVMEEFVNFDLPTHKTIEYLNQHGLVWFSKYALRIQKIIVKGVMDRPFDAALSYMTSAFWGLDHIGNSLLGVTKDLTSPLGDPFSTFTNSVDKILPISYIKSLFNP